MFYNYIIDASHPSKNFFYTLNFKFRRVAPVAGSGNKATLPVLTKHPGPCFNRLMSNSIFSCQRVI